MRLGCVVGAQECAELCINVRPVDEELLADAVDRDRLRLAAEHLVEACLLPQSENTSR